MKLFRSIIRNYSKNRIIVPSHISGGEELYTQMGFIVQSILADRYNHR